MDLGIKGKRALVLSAGGGLGSAIAFALANEGVELCIADRDESALQATADRLAQTGITDILLPGMRERSWGRIITSTSSGVIAPIPNLALSNSLRVALVGWSKSLARDVAADGVTANVVVPGRIATARTAFLDSAKAKREGREAASVKAESAASIPVGRYGRPDEYADAVAFLASERAAYITGTTLRVDGGLIPAL